MDEQPLPEALLAWIPRQRWYAGKGAGASLSQRGGWRIAGKGGSSGTEVVTYYVLDRQSSGATLYQVPVTHRAEALSGGHPIWSDETGHYYDGPHDPAYVTAILDLIASESEADGTRGHRQPGSVPVTVLESSVLKGEQSNTSIICRVDHG